MMPNVNRDEHLKWAKERALEYLDRGDLKNAVTSILSDLDQHPETRMVSQNMGFYGIFLLTNKQGPREIRRFIEGFN